MPKVGNERRARIDWQKNLFQDRIRNRHGIVGIVFWVLIVQSQVERCERKLASIENTGIGQLGVIHFLYYFRWNLFRGIAVIRGKYVEHFFIPYPVLQHLRRRLDKIPRNMSSGKSAILGASDN